MRSLTRYNPNDKKYRMRDAQEIRESGFDQIAREDKVSRRQGRLEEEQDWIREQQLKKRHHYRRRD